MIVKNDAQRLRRCLKSVKDLVSDLVIVDTGSTDATCEVAREFGARLFEREWPDDFSQALNWALEKIGHEWTLRLDSDEWLLPDQVDGIRPLLSRTDLLGVRFIRENYQADGRYTESSLLRLWRTDARLRFHGIVHERIPLELLKEVAAGRDILESGIRIGHDGYLAGTLPNKHRRNLLLVEKELATNPNDLYYIAERVRILYLLYDPQADRAANALIQELEKHQHENMAPSAILSGPLAIYLDRTPDAALNSRQVDLAIRLTRGWFADEPAATYAAAKTLIRRKELRNALDALLDLERMSETGQYIRTGFAHPAMLQEALWQNLALVAHQLGRANIAARNYERLLRQNPDHPVAKQNLPLLLKK
ncbi:MAG TPA: glycosyltransferase family 2 protein [Fimbriimonadaceae bacterium]|nr:glycosyltransferase family 2 protein [Fimbriimonadaceae bacterium]